MPTYNFYDTKKKKHVVLEFDSWSEAEKFEKTNPHMNWCCSATPMADPIRLGRQKPSSGFRDLLREMKKKTKGDGINTFVALLGIATSMSICHFLDQLFFF